ncbi:hypothetical protein DFP72DRAFT_839256 [Ephemerocybe angulata]|uniref:Uncharacterized protein n=1 Tax=Ephemerocybe angulata TaxID=980116 RepID=A0A8H6MEA4_9AGAR|nr:hypothetical protein DFP72DRAFT_839256 [Tulosesus angulatus]
MRDYDRLYFGGWGLIGKQWNTWMGSLGLPLVCQRGLGCASEASVHSQSCGQARAWARNDSGEIFCAMALAKNYGKNVGGEGAGWLFVDLLCGGRGGRLKEECVRNISYGPSSIFVDMLTSAWPEKASCRVEGVLATKSSYNEAVCPRCEDPRNTAVSRGPTGESNESAAGNWVNERRLAKSFNGRVHYNSSRVIRLALINYAWRVRG